MLSSPELQKKLMSVLIIIIIITTFILYTHGSPIYVITFITLEAFRVCAISIRVCRIYAFILITSEP